MLSPVSPPADINCPTNADSGAADDSQEWENLQTFLGLLTVRGYPDKKLYGLWTLRDALEEQEYDKFPAAVGWIIMAGKVLYNSTDEYAPHGGADPARPGRLFQGNRGFSKERWAFWKRAFLDAGNRDDLGEETRMWAQKGAETMTSVESV